MQVSSYLEAFLSVYGWMMYNTLYELFAMSWLIFLPFLRQAFDVFMDSTSDVERSYGYYKSGLLKFLVMLLILFTCVVPMHNFSINNAKVQSVCEDPQTVEEAAHVKGGHQFQFDLDDSARAPLLPALIMRLGNGMNNVIYSSMNCVADVKAHQLTLATAGITDSAVRDEVNRYAKECHQPALTRLNEAANGDTTVVNKIISSNMKESNRSADFIQYYPGSPLIQAVMNGSEGLSVSLVKRGWFATFFKGDLTEEFNLFIQRLSNNGNQESAILYSRGPVAGMTSDHPDNSDQAKANNSGPVSCAKWWQGSNSEEGLGARVYKASSYDFINKSVTDPYVRHTCGGSPMDALVSGITATNPDPEDTMAAIESCKQKIFKSYDYDSKEDMDEVVAWSAIKSNYNIASNSEERTIMGAGATIGVVGQVLGIFSKSAADLLSPMLKNISGFYAEMFMYRVVLKFLQPMLLMGIFIFWGIFMIASEYQGRTVLKGLSLILVITLFPSLWQVADHLDGALFDALVPQRTNYEKGEGAKHSHIERLILDMASTVFYIILPLLLLFIVSEAGGSSGERAVQGTDRQTSRIGGDVGRGVGGVKFRNKQQKPPPQNNKS